MNYGYIRVSTDKQTVENQRFEIEKFCSANELPIDSWFEETISGTKDISKREIGKLLKKMKTDDILICSEISRIGRSLFMVMSVLNECTQRGIKVWTIKDNFRLGDDISSKVIAFAFSLSAEIERNLISQRTKEALARKKAEGIILGRPKGSKTKVHFLDEHKDYILKQIQKGISVTKISKKIGCHRTTIANYMNNRAVPL